MPKHRQPVVGFFLLGGSLVTSAVGGGARMAPLWMVPLSDRVVGKGVIGGEEWR